MGVSQSGTDEPQPTSSASLAGGDRPRRYFDSLRRRSPLRSRLQSLLHSIRLLRPSMHVSQSGTDKPQPSSSAPLAGGDDKGDGKGDGSGADSVQQASTSAVKPSFPPKPRDASRLSSRPEPRAFIVPRAFLASRPSQDHHIPNDSALDPGDGNSKGDGNGTDSAPQASTSASHHPPGPLFPPTPFKPDPAWLPVPIGLGPSLAPASSPSRASQDHDLPNDSALNPVTSTKSASNHPHGPLLATTFFRPSTGTDSFPSRESPLLQYWGTGLLRGIAPYLETSGLVPLSALTMIDLRQIEHPGHAACGGRMGGTSQVGDEPYWVISIGVRPGSMDRREAAYLALELRQHLDSILAPLLPRGETELDYNRDKLHVEVRNQVPGGLFANGDG